MYICEQPRNVYVDMLIDLNLTPHSHALPTRQKSYLASSLSTNCVLLSDYGVAGNLPYVLQLRLKPSSIANRLTPTSLSFSLPCPTRLFYHPWS